jgi:uncharacterized protein YjbI with pentapeptide repeats
MVCSHVIHGINCADEKTGKGPDPAKSKTAYEMSERVRADVKTFFQNGQYQLIQFAKAANFSHFSFKNANFRQSTLAYSILKSADQSGANFSQATLDNVDLSLVICDDKTMFDNSILSGCKSFAGASLTGANFTRAQLINCEITDPKSLNSCTFSEVTFQDTSIHFDRRTTFKPHSLDKIKCQGASFSNCSFPADQRLHIAESIKGKQEFASKFADCSLVGSKWQASALADTRFHDCDCSNADFSGITSFSNSTFQGSVISPSVSAMSLVGATFNEKNDCIFTKCDLTCTDFRLSRVKLSSFQSCRLQYTIVAKSDPVVGQTTDETLLGALGQGKLRKDFLLRVPEGESMLIIVVEKTPDNKFKFAKALKLDKVDLNTFELDWVSFINRLEDDINAPDVTDGNGTPATRLSKTLRHQLNLPERSKLKKIERKQIEDAASAIWRITP